MDAIWVTIRLHASLWASMSKHLNKVTRILGFGALLLYDRLLVHFVFFFLDKISLSKKKEKLLHLQNLLPSSLCFYIFLFVCLE